MHEPIAQSATHAFSDTFARNNHVSESFHPIAVVGMACRFPKGLESIEALWNALKTKFSAIDGVPKDRWTADRYYSSNPAAKGKAYIRRGGFLTHDVSGFDAAFFGISPRDAENMDPQQRLLLEVVWEAFENSGLLLPDHAGKNVGVYVGGFMLDHMITQMSASNRSQINQNTAAGMMMTMLSNRISHTFDLRGPSLSIDTACSSSLVAFNYACHDIWRGTAEMAIVGGANCMLRPEYPMGMCKGHFLSRDGECKSFDSRADGYGRGEGAGAVILKPLAKAIADRDPILATVIGTGSNQDGRTPGISMPSGEAQKALIEDVCQRFQIDPKEVRYVECHGTGTAVGDPIEATAIGSVYGLARKESSPVVIGSIKSNIGHLEAAAGVAGVIKAVLTLMHGQATPLANLIEPNPAINFEELNVRLSDDHIALASPNESFCVAVNSFGYGGSNAHAILRSVPTHSRINASMMNGTHVNGAMLNGSGDHATRPFPYFLPISGRSDKAVTALAASYRDLLNSGVNLSDVLYSASLKRAHLSHRAVVKGSSRSELLASLEALATGTESENVVRGSEPYQGHRKPVFVFTGMGPQWWAMGQELYANDSIYRQAVTEADRVFQEISGFSILTEMLRSEAASRITETQFAQPANLMIQIGLLAIMRAAGVHPGAVVGHSVGELGSAYASGALSLKDVMTVCFHRSQLQATCKGQGAMLAVGMTKEQASVYVDACEGRVSIAAVNGPTNLTIAGESADIDAIASQLNAAEIFHRKLEVEVPYHSPLMEPIMQPLATALRSVQPSVPSIPLYSTVTGARVEGVSYGADYWPLNIRQAVEFASAISAIIADGYNTFIEIGPHPVLATSLRDCIKAASVDCRTVFTLRRNTPEVPAVHRGIMGVYAAGCEIDWTVHNGHGNFIQLPNYAWQRERFWLENDRAVQDRIAPIVHPILGIQEAPGSPVWRNDFDHEPVNYLRDHVVTGMAVLPGAAYMEALLELNITQFPDARSWSLRDLEIHAPMIITGDRGLDCVTTFDPISQSAIIRGLENGRLGVGQTHITAKLVSHSTAAVSHISRGSLSQAFTRHEPIADFYRSLDQMGLSYGPAFQTVRELRLNDSGDKVLSHIVVNDELCDNLSQYCIHPTLLDACFQTLSAMLGNSENMYLPTGVGELTIYAKSLPKSIWCLAEKTMQTNRHIDCDLTLIDEEGTVVAAIRSMRSTAASKRERVDQFGDRVKRQILGYEWSYGENLTEPKRLGFWMVVGQPEGLADDVASRFEHYGAMIAARVTFGDRYERSANQFTIRANHVEDTDRLFSECGELDGIAFLHGIDESADEVDPSGESALKALVCFSQSLEKQSRELKPRCYVVTQSAFGVSDQDDEVSPRQSALNGFVRVAFNELDGYRFSSIDLPSRVSFDNIDALTLELLCDADHDEVALRGSLRLVSQLLESKMISDDRIEYRHLTDDAPILVRPLRPDCESVGTARLVDVSLAPLGANAVQLRVESSIVPANLLLDPAADMIDQPTIEFVGHVLAVGSDVSDLRPGMRVAGFAPPDLSSHLSLPREMVHVVEIEAEDDATTLLSSISLSTRSELAIADLAIAAEDTALVDSSPLGLLIAKSLVSRGIRVVLLSDDPEAYAQSMSETYPVCSRCPAGIQRAMRDFTEGKKFNLLVAGMSSWSKSFDFKMLAVNASIVDTDDSAIAGHCSAACQFDCADRHEFAVNATKEVAIRAPCGHGFASIKEDRGTTHT
jgi:acyl transferase domain-containing protein